MLRVDLTTANSVLGDFRGNKSAYVRNNILRIEHNNKIFAEYLAEVCAYAVPETCEEEKIKDILTTGAVGVSVVYDALARTFAQEKTPLPKITQWTIDSMIQSWREDGLTVFNDEMQNTVMSKIKKENPILAELLNCLARHSVEKILGSSLAMTGAVTYTLIARQFESDKWDKSFRM